MVAAVTWPRCSARRLIGVLANGILLLGVPAIWSRFVYGICIVVAVSSDRLRRVAMERLA